MKSNISLPDLIEEAANLCDKERIPKINDTTGEVISSIVMIKQPKSILEIGGGGGYSTLWMSKYISRSCNIDSIEIDNKRALIAKKLIKQANLEKQVSVICDEAINWLSSNKMKKYDLIFIDAKKSHYIEYFKKSERRLKKNGVIIFDDTFYWERHNKKSKDKNLEPKNKKDIINKLFQMKSRQEYQKLHTFLSSKKSFQISHIQVGNGLSIMQKK